MSTQAFVWLSANTDLSQSHCNCTFWRPIVIMPNGTVENRHSVVTCTQFHTYIHTRVLTKLHASCSTTNSQFVRFTWPAPEWTLIRCFRLHNRHGLRYSMGLRVATPSNGIKGDKSEKYCSEKCGAAGESVWDIWGWYTCRYIFGLWTQFCVRKRKLSFSNMYMYIWSYKYLYFNNCNTRLRVGSSSLLQKCLTFVVVLQIWDFYWPTEISGCWQRHLI